jgi:folate-dependent phosphoribosylglycinamide formyltransferase PurN
LSIGWFSTGRDEAARQLLEVVHQQIQNGNIKGKIIFAFSNREPGEDRDSDLFFELVRSYEIPLSCFSSQKFKEASGIAGKVDEEKLHTWRLEYDRRVMEKLKDLNPDLCVLAGYMLIVGKELCRRYDMINLHPAVPGGPKGSWQDVIWDLIENRATRSGVMMHLVTPELDSGPVITYCTYPITGKPFDNYWRELKDRSVIEIKKNEGEKNALFQLIRQHGLSREFPLIISTLKAFGDGEVKIETGRLIARDGKPISGFDLTDEVNKAVEMP